MKWQNLDCMLRYGLDCKSCGNMEIWAIVGCLGWVLGCLCVLTFEPIAFCDESSVFLQFPPSFFCRKSHRNCFVASSSIPQPLQVELEVVFPVV